MQCQYKINTNLKTEYTQRLHHIQPVGATFFVTFRLFGSIPYSDLKKIKEKYYVKIAVAKRNESKYERNLAIFNLRKQYLIEYDKLLDNIKSGPMFLANSQVLDIIKTQIHRFDNDLYELIAYCVMSNHVHILINTGLQLDGIEDDEELEARYKPLDDIMKRIKGPSAWYINKHIGRSGQFWERESYDIYIRNEKMLNNVMSYIVENPVKAKMVENGNDYPGNYLKM
jgi:putative transposase